MPQDIVSLKDELIAAPTRYHSAISRGGSALVEFDQYWATLLAKVPDSVEDQSLAQLAYSSASHIAMCAESLLTLEDLTCSMVAGTTNELAKLTLNERLSPTDCLPRNAAGGPLPPVYIHSAYDWLMKNVHNPYPSAETKQVLATRSGFSTREIHQWFRDMRRAIGWVAFCRKHFFGSRSLAVEAATRVLLDQGISQSETLEIEVDILSIRGVAECLYPEQHILAPDEHFSGLTFLPRALSAVEPSTHATQGRGVPNCGLLDVATQSRSSEPRCQTTTASPSTASRKRRLSDAGIEETRKRSRIIPGEPRRHAVSDPMPRSVKSSDLDTFTFWDNMFNSPLSSPLTSLDPSRPMVVIPNEWNPPISDEQIDSLSSFWSSLVPENETLPVPLLVSSSANTLPQDTSSYLLPIDHQSFNEVFPFIDPTLAAVEPSTEPEGLEQLLASSSRFPDNLFDFSCTGSPDNSSDTSSIMTLSPPRTPAIEPSLMYSANTTDIPPLNENPIMDPEDSYNPLFYNIPFETPSLLDDVLREKIDNDPTTHVFSVTEPVLSVDSFDFLSFSPLSIP